MAITTAPVVSAGLFSTIGLAFGFVSRTILVFDKVLSITEDISDIGKAHSSNALTNTRLDMSTKLTLAQRQAAADLAASSLPAPE